MLGAIKSRIASGLSPDQREAAKHLLRGLKLYRPRPEQLYLEAVVEASPSTFLIQIGANDGLDFVRSVVRRQGRRHRIEGVLVEPQRYFHQQLVRNYAGLGGFEIVNLAISDSARSMTLYHVDYDNTAVPGWAKGLGSFSRDVLMSHAHLIPDLESVIRSVEVQCISVGDLAAMAGERELDVLITDTEGHDYVILGQFDFARIRPKLVVFESKHLSAGDLSACEAMLAGHGYQVVHLGNDNSVALRGDIAEATQRAVAAA